MSEVVWERGVAEYTLELLEPGLYPDEDKWTAVQKFTTLEAAQTYADNNLASVGVRVVKN